MSAALAKLPELFDESGEIVVFDHHGADRLPEDLRGRVTGLWELNPQTDEEMRARLFVP